MAWKAYHPCAENGCAELCPPGQKYCDKHKAAHPEEVRSAAGRGYDWKWQKFRKQYLKAHPWCEACLAEKPPRYTPSQVIDHIHPFRGDPMMQYDLDNLQALCNHHHDVKTGKYDSHPEYRY